MKRHLFLWVLLIVLIAASFFLVYLGWTTLSAPGIAFVGVVMVVAALVIANEFRRPLPQEYFRKKALFPKIPDNFLADKPKSGSIIFGKDYHTHKTVIAEVGHHVLLCGSTGSGKTATCLLPSILNYDGTGSLQIVDIKSRELSYKTADVFNEKTQIVDLNLRKPYVYGWDLLYKLKKDGTDTEQAVLDIVRRSVKGCAKSGACPLHKRDTMQTGHHLTMGSLPLGRRTSTTNLSKIRRNPIW